MKTNTFMGAPRETYNAPATRIINVNMRGNMLLLNSDGVTTQKTPDLEEQDYSNIWGN